MGRSTLQALVLTVLIASGGCQNGCMPPPTDAGTDGGVEVADLQISEVMAINDGAYLDSADEADDWVEIHNAGDQAVALDGYGLSDSVATIGDYVFPADLTLEPGERLIVWADRDPEQGLLHADFKLSGDGEEIVLSKDGEVIDAFAFGPQCPDVSFGRPSAGGAPTWLESPTPGEANSAARTEPPECPEAPPSDAGPPTPAVTDVFINELAPVGTGLLDQDDEAEPWVELFNASAEEQELTDHTLTDDESLPTRWAFIPGQRIAAGGTLLLFLDGEPQEGLDHAGFALDTEAAVLQLRAPEGDLLDEVPVLDADVGESYGRSPDGSDTWLALESPTPDGPNSDAASDSDDGGVPVDAGAADDAGTLDGGLSDGGPSDAGDGGA